MKEEPSTNEANKATVARELLLLWLTDEAVLWMRVQEKGRTI
jgi:hypothetical protein